MAKRTKKYRQDRDWLLAELRSCRKLMSRGFCTPALKALFVWNRSRLVAIRRQYRQSVRALPKLYGEIG